MDGNLLRHQMSCNNNNSSLMRLKSAPSSMIANYVDEVVADVVGESDSFVDFLPNHRSSSPDHGDAESIFARFMSSCGGGNSDLDEPKVLNGGNTNGGGGGFLPTSQMMYLPPSPPPPQQQPQMVVQNHGSASAVGSIGRERDFRGLNSMEIDGHQQVQQQQLLPQVKLGGGGGGGGGGEGGSANLIRHSSSPAGLFGNLSVENGFTVMRSSNNVGNFRGGNSSTNNGDVPATTISRLNYSSGPTSSSRIQDMGTQNGDDVSLGSTSSVGGNRYLPNFPINSWEDSELDNFQDHKRVRDMNGKMILNLSSSETQSVNVGNRPHSLTHHFSLPKSTEEMAAILQFQDSVPCKIRAKRGCATHPRSIAERVRRTKISERMRKLQELVPNMDKQTNTADMLDLAVEYIKDLQKEVKTLNEHRSNCTCSKPYSKPSV